MVGAFQLLRGFGPIAAGVEPAAPTLAITDNADGTGGVATITGTDAGATVTVYSQAINGELGTATWTARGSRTGNGTIAMSPAPAVGIYLFRAEAVLAGFGKESNIVIAAITNGTQAIHYRCMTATQARLQLMLLPGIANSSIVVRQVPLARKLTLPAIVISGVGKEATSANAGTVANDDVGYPVLVSLVAADNQDLVAYEQRFKWRERIFRAFNNQRLPGVPETYRCIVEPDAVIDLPQWLKNTFSSSLVIRCTARQSRGLVT